MLVLHSYGPRVNTDICIVIPDFLFVCLSCGLAYQSTAMVMSGHSLNFVGLVPKIGHHDIQKVLQILPPN